MMFLRCWKQICFTWTYQGKIFAKKFQNQKILKQKLRHQKIEAEALRVEAEATQKLPLPVP